MNIADTKNSSDISLPSTFAALEPFVAEWALPTEKQRAVKRVSTPIEDVRASHQALFPMLESILRYFLAFPNDPTALPPDAARLYALTQNFMEISAPVDLEWDSPDIEDVFPVSRIVFQPPSTQLS